MTDKKNSWASAIYLRLFTAAAIAAICAFLILVSAAAAENTSEDIFRQIASQRQDLEAKRLELSDLDRRIATAGQYLDQKRLELADATSRLRDSEDRYNATLKLYEGRLSAIYKLGDANMYAVMLSSEDLSDAMARFSYLSKVSENDERLVEQVRAEAETVRQMREKVDGLKRAQAEDVETLQARRQERERQIAAGNASINKQTAELAQALAREQEREQQQAEQAGSDQDSSFTGNFGAPVMSNTPPAGLQPTGITLKGMASWYGPGFQGNRTANGEIYNMYAFTAAHKSLPFNTWLKVTHGGRSVFVRINDRGPYVGGRILDLSFSSAQAIGISGVGFVSAEIYR